MTKPEFLTKDIAAQRLGLSVRRLMEISAEGRIERHRKADPETGRETAMFRAEDVERLIREGMPTPAVRELALQRRALMLPQVSGGPVSATAKLWLTLDEAAEVSGLSVRLLVRLIRHGKLAALDEHTIGNTRWRVRRADIEGIQGEFRTPANHSSVISAV